MLFFLTKPICFMPAVMALSPAVDTVDLAPSTAPVTYVRSRRHGLLWVLRVARRLLRVLLRVLVRLRRGTVAVAVVPSLAPAGIVVVVVRRAALALRAAVLGAARRRGAGPPRLRRGA